MKKKKHGKMHPKVCEHYLSDKYSVYNGINERHVKRGWGNE
jgi:hypothetical protein